MEEIINSELKIENMIYEIRGKQVMLDSDLAKLYQVETKRINEAVKRNKERFPNDFYFILDMHEYKEVLKSQNATSKPESVGKGGLRKMPHVFTEQGVAMLATVLKTEVASRVSVNIMRAFVAMRKYLSNNLIEQQLLEKQVLSNTKRIEKTETELAMLQESFKKFEEKKVVNENYKSSCKKKFKTISK